MISTKQVISTSIEIYTARSKYCKQVEKEYSIENVNQISLSIAEPGQSEKSKTTNITLILGNQGIESISSHIRCSMSSKNGLQNSKSWHTQASPKNCKS